VQAAPGVGEEDEAAVHAGLDERWPLLVAQLDALDRAGGDAAPGATALSAYPPLASPRWATTRRPIHDSSTPAPIASMTPATSRPGTIGSCGRA
jgi:hypothetical protein